ncbi:hypothetical protein [Microbacterium elymi]|uniref:Uncharacterized protein n=1 Tax=Microbacterium elymi TaxID=2909587 RepID=A0ABY5NMP4_9MICO|nr:hypothetical protein [Microbacterium elymi]UUT36389.1 hypothetical protein L2X98_26030 [Microbacterium elymi]
MPLENVLEEPCLVELDLCPRLTAVATTDQRTVGSHDAVAKGRRQRVEIGLLEAEGRLDRRDLQEVLAATVSAPPPARVVLELYEAVAVDGIEPVERVQHRGLPGLVHPDEGRDVVLDGHLTRVQHILVLVHLER